VPPVAGRLRVQIRFIAMIKPRFKSEAHGCIQWRKNFRQTGNARPTTKNEGAAGPKIEALSGAGQGPPAPKQGRPNMAYMQNIDCHAARPAEAAAGPDVMFELGMMYAAGSSVPLDLIEAHKWFNLAAAKGFAAAAEHRREVAELMSAAEIAKAQRAARAWLTLH